MVMRRSLIAVASLAIVSGLVVAASAQDDGTPWMHAIATLEEPKYPEGFAHFDYVNPDAPKGGTITSGAVGTFDSFNAFIIKGSPAGLAGLFETLTTQTEDDAMSEYGLIAESMEIAPDKSWIIYTLRSQARWHDGKPITADDVVFSFDTLMEKGHPQYRYYYVDVAKAEKLDDHRVKFQFKHGGNRELPVIMGQLPILPKHWWESRNFENVLLEPPLGSGPYKLGKFDMGRSYTMERVPDYWGKDLPINIGTDNYGQRRVVYFQDPAIQMEAFKAGTLDIRPNENSAKQWATGYEFPAVKDGRVIKEIIPHKNPAGVQGFIFNIRKPLFADREVREALGYAFDFEWSNKTLFYGLYKRSRSYFQNSEMEAKGLPSPEELEILNPLKDQIPPEVFTAEYSPPKTDGSGNARDNLAKAAALLDEAGWKVEGGRRVKDGKAFEFEIMVDDQPMERVALPFAQNLERIGIKATVRVVDSAQYQKRSEDFDFDMTSDIWGQSLSPGNEQWEFWGSKSADSPGSRNSIGIKNPAVDKLIELIVTAQTREDLIIRCRALDRVLQWNYYLVPHFHSGNFKVAYWNKFGMPQKRPDPLYLYGSSGWWIDPAKEAALAGRKNAEQPAQQAAASPAPAPAAAQPAPQTPAPAAQAGSTPDDAAGDRGQSPLIYGAGAIVVVVVAYLLGRRRGKSS
jgi:microcin C transport system substrate-binding protein